MGRSQPPFSGGRGAEGRSDDGDGGGEVVGPRPGVTRGQRPDRWIRVLPHLPQQTGDGLPSTIGEPGVRHRMTGHPPPRER
jgi:hypothetical protein